MSVLRILITATSMQNATIMMVVTRALAKTVIKAMGLLVKVCNIYKVRHYVSINYNIIALWYRRRKPHIISQGISTLA